MSLRGFDGEPLTGKPRPPRPLKRYKVLATGWRYWRDGEALTIERYVNGAGTWEEAGTVNSEAEAVAFVDRALKNAAAWADTNSDTNPPHESE